MLIWILCTFKVLHFYFDPALPYSTPKNKDANLETGFMLGSITDYRSIILLLIIGQSISDSTDCNLQAIISQLYNVHW